MTSSQILGISCACAISLASATILEAQTKGDSGRVRTRTAQDSSTEKVKPTATETAIYKDYIFALDIDSEDNPRGYSIRPLKDGNCDECANSWERARIDGVAKTYKVTRKDVYKAVKKVLDYNK